MITGQAEDILRSMFQKGMLKDIPPSWSEEEVVDYMSRFNDYLINKGKTPEKGDEKLDEAPEWAKELDLRLNQLQDLVPVFERMNRERAQEAEQAAKRLRLFNSRFETDEERTLLAAEREKQKPEAYPLEPREQFHDYTQDNLVTPGPEKYPYEPETYGGTEQKAKRKSDSNLTMSSGTKRKEERRKAEEGKYPETGSEELKRKLFNQLMDAQKRQNEALESEREIKALPERITDLAKRLSKTPYGKWTVADMSEAVKYFTADQVSQLVRISEERNGSTR
jgi:uncharacterized protein YaaR (DUF327 family)